MVPLNKIVLKQKLESIKPLVTRTCGSARTGRGWSQRCGRWWELTEVGEVSAIRHDNRSERGGSWRRRHKTVRPLQTKLFYVSQTPSALRPAVSAFCSAGCFFFAQTISSKFNPLFIYIIIILLRPSKNVALLINIDKDRFFRAWLNVSNVSSNYIYSRTLWPFNLSGIFA